jgi:SAM-dependent methyltransferase
MGIEPTLTDFVEWDVQNWSAALDYWTSCSSQDLSRCTVLEIGSGGGGISLWFALQGARVISSDVNFPQEKALAKHRASRVSSKIEYEVFSATDIPHVEKFDVIVFKSMLGAINTRELQAKAINEMHKALKKGGELFFAENLTASSLHGFLRRKFVKWGNEWRYVTLEEMTAFLSPFSDLNTQAVGFAGTFGRTEKQRNLLGVSDRLLFDRVIPKHWKYILLGVARK